MKFAYNDHHGTIYLLKTKVKQLYTRVQFINRIACTSSEVMLHGLVIQSYLTILMQASYQLICVVGCLVTTVAAMSCSTDCQLMGYLRLYWQSIIKNMRFYFSLHFNIKLKMHFHLLFFNILCSFLCAWQQAASWLGNYALYRLY